MKKLILSLTVLLLVFSLVACNAQDTPDNKASAFVFRAGNTEIALDAKASPILEALGEPKSYNESPSCAFDGLDKVYVYNGFKLQTYPQNGVDFILSVSLIDDSVATPEGISIGASKEQVLATYGTPSEETASAILFVNNHSTIQFLLRDGKVTNINYLRSK